ncbi:F-box DNA helicase 1 [Platichthys flesus]|uniref:F-box DNA helicase 1 n=1 Tax=Platichthys flesus TaxID=8260 RepID=UPI002DB588B6|nr:F-box DNA helicase 1 [Platichthys flesus]
MEVAVKAKVKRRHLNANECDELGQSAEGTNALTQPLTFNQGQGSCEPNKWLFPRTTKKRRKCGMVSQPQLEEEEEEEVDEIDDDSLLAAALSSESQETYEEEEEIDDSSLLASEEKVDYLEGMTAEMFGVDDFEIYDRDNHKKDEEVEALPDAHYGLVGSSKDLLQPQGCIDDLPLEVLRQVLGYIPAQDLYRSISLVCHHWRSIVQDTKFLPFKKQYYRYMMREKDAELEMVSNLKDNGITEPALERHSIRHLVVFMAQHKVGERVSPEDILVCVKKHRLFPMAEASMRLRIPDIQKYFNHGSEGPNPFAAMAIILILSENIGDVQDLVSLLSGCMSHSAITEYLSHMAMMLLALERSEIQINNRSHYNIYYVLQLMENGPFSVGSTQNGRPQMQLTCEQQNILSHDIQNNHVVKIIAFAGTGKTTTLVKYAEQRPHLRFLYVAFNKSVACEAERRFPKNVDCKTVHSLAFSDVGRMYQNRQKLTFNLKPYTLSSVLPKGRGGFIKAKVLTTTLNTFMASADPTITTSHVASTHVSNKGNKTIITDDEKLLVVHDARTIWNKMKDLNEKRAQAYYMTHDGYLKLWQLQSPKPCLSDQYDVIFIDEAQDCTPAIMDVLLSQKCGKILVGDPHQQIYTFRGAVNALHVVDHTHIYYLTRSFRFGAEIAYVAATILKVCKRVQKTLVGGKQKGGVCNQAAVETLEFVRTGVSPNPGKIAILSRCNYSVFSTAVSLTDVNPLCRIHFIGDVKNIGLNRILDIWRLMQAPDQEPNAFKDPLIRSFAKKSRSSFHALKQYIDQTEDLELASKVIIVEKYRSRIPQLVKLLDSCFEKDFRKADFIVGTVHKAKGLEFDTVVIGEDFTLVPSPRYLLQGVITFSFTNIPDDEWNLLYVAVTRAKTTLIITKSIYNILTVDGEYFLKSQMASSVRKEGEALTCFRNSLHPIVPDSAFIMSTQQWPFTDGVSDGGLLCEGCVWIRIGPTALLMLDEHIYG